MLSATYIVFIGTNRNSLMKTPVIFFIFLMLGPTTVIAETHEKVEAALNYQTPENTCEKPTKFANTDTRTAPQQSAGSSDYFSGSSTASTSDTDSYTIRRLEKKEEKWRKCVDQYKSTLLEDMQTLKSSAQFGLTQEQADMIVAKMLAIQNIYITPDGVLETEGEDDDDSDNDE
jgi:hypothetical protein